MNLSSTPNSANVELEIGLLAQRAGDAAEAETCYRRALERDPNDPDAVHLLGMVCQETGRADEALQLLLRAVELDPSPPHFHSNLGSLLGRLGRSEEAIERLWEAIRLRPEYPNALHNLALALEKTGKLTESADAHRKAIALRQDYAPSHHHYGDVLRKLGRPRDAAERHRQAIRLKPDWWLPYVGLAASCGELGLLAEATECHRKLTELTPNSMGGGSDYLHMLHYDPAVSRQTLFDEAKRWAARYAEKLTATAAPHDNDRDPERPLRVGFVSGDFREHPVARLIEPILANLDRDSFSTFCYSDMRRKDDHTRAIRAVAGTWRETAALNDENLAALIREDRIDILVDLSGHMGRHRLPMFARKPAPVQVTHFNYPDTTGMSAMDYRITDNLAENQWPVGRAPNQSPVMRGPNQWPVVSGQWPGTVRDSHRSHNSATDGETASGDEAARPMERCHTMTSLDAPVRGEPDSHDRYSVEKLVRLPKCGWCYQPTTDGPAVGPLPMLERGHVTFAALNKPLKHSAPCVALWARVLKAVPGSRLMLLGSAEPGQNQPIEAQFAPHGIGPERLKFVRRRPRREYLALYNEADIGLDPFPYNGGVTSCDSLWMGVPFVTLVGNSYLSRQGLMFLTNLGMSKLVAHSPEQYVHLAARLASKPQRLSALRAGLRARFAGSPICDGPGFARDLGEAYRKMWKDWCAGVAK